VLNGFAYQTLKPCGIHSVDIEVYTFLDSLKYRAFPRTVQKKSGPCGDD